MGYNQDLEYRIDGHLTTLGEIYKKKMFGGIGYLINGNMCFGVHKESLIVRVAPEKAEELMNGKNIVPFNMTGRPMKGWISVSPDLVETDDRLFDMLTLGAGFAKTLTKK